MHRCAEIHNSVSSLVSLLHAKGEHHVELGVSRKRRNNIDLQKIISWFNDHSPFSITEPCLKGINCNNAETVKISKDHCII